MSDLVKRAREIAPKIDCDCESKWCNGNAAAKVINEMVDRIEQLERELTDQINRKIGYYNEWVAEKALADELHADLVHSGISMNRTILKYRKARGL